MTTQTKKHVATMSKLADAFIASIAPVLAGKEAFIAARDTLTAASGGAWGAMVALLVEAETLAETYSYVGDGKKMPGSLREKLGDNYDSVKAMLSQARQVAVARFNHGFVIDATMGKNKMVQAARDVIGKVDAAAPSEPEIKAGSNDAIGQFIALHGVAAVLNKMAEILKAERKSATDAGALKAIAEHYSKAA
jgi:hypothetical protein